MKGLVWDRGEVPFILVQNNLPRDGTEKVLNDTKIWKQRCRFEAIAGFQVREAVS